MKKAFQLVTILVMLSVLLAACTSPTPTTAPAEATKAPEATTVPNEAAKEATKAPVEASAAEVVNSLGIKLPADAAPIEKQVETSSGEFGPWEHWADGWYGCKTPVLYATQEQLLTIGVDNQLIPIEAESWEANADATEWTFHMRKGLQWSDGKPITAKDWVYTFQYITNAESGFDFLWYFDQIKNINDVNAGKMKPEELGVKAPDDNTLVFEMKSSTPYWPALVASAFVLPKQAVDKCGAKVWSTDPSCYVASGPYIMTRYERDKVIVMELNKNYKGNAKPLINKIVYTYTSLTGSNQGLTPYQNDEVDTINLKALPQNVIDEVVKDTQYKDQLMTGLAQKTTYITFDTTKKPFSDPKVREAFAISIDRDTICDKVLNGTCKADYTFLPLNFPGYTESLKSIQAYNPDKAKQLMSEAGYPDGKGFPQLTYYVRQDDAVAPEAIAAMWQETLGVTVNIETYERGTFMQKMAGRQFQLYQLAYGADFPDPDNFLGLWISSANRHEWKSDQYDKLLEASRVETDTAKRQTIITDAEKLLLSEFAVIPLTTPVNMSLEKTWYMNDIKDYSRQGKNTSLYGAKWYQNFYFTKDTPDKWPAVDPEFLK